MTTKIRTIIGSTIRLVAVGAAITVALSAPAAAGARPAPTSEPTSLLPEPTGSLPVGVRTVPSVSPDASTRVWYPARRGTGTERAVYLDDDEAAAYGLPAGQLQHARPVAVEGARPARATKPRPAVVLMPGWGLPIALSTALAQELASNGYVVVAVDPAVGSEDRMAMPANTANPGRRLEQVRAAVDYAVGTEIAAVAGPVDRNRVAVGGHSIAGAVAFQTSLTDPRVHAVFDLDGWLHGPASTTPVDVPALMIDASGLEPATRAVVARAPRAVMVSLDGATHLDVTDLPCLAAGMDDAVTALLGLGSIGAAGTATTDAIVLRFLDAVLRDHRATPTAASLTRGLDGVRP